MIIKKKQCNFFFTKENVLLFCSKYIWGMNVILQEQLNAIENLLWYLIVYIRVKTDMWHGFTKTECKAM